MKSLARKNDKKQVISYENSIKKSNELSMAKLSQGLTLNQMQLLAYAIYSTQQDGRTEFHKADFEKKFGLSRYLTEDAYKDSERILSLKVSTEDLENAKFKFWNVFSSMEYDKGLFQFEWNSKMIPHILELKEKYITTDLTITSNFKSGFSWTLYDYIKAHYGYWHKPISKEALMKLFGVENRKTYLNSTAQFKRGVLDVAINELNKYTEFEVWYVEEKQGRTIAGFDLIWSTGENNVSATQKQIRELHTILDAVFEDTFKYVNLNDQKDRERAIKLIRELESYKEYIKEPICITKERAEFLILNANSYVRELEQYLESERKEETPFYNWLEES